LSISLTLLKREFDRWINTCKLEDVSLPNEFTLIRKAKRARDLVKKPITNVFDEHIFIVRYQTKLAL
jgi:hypothetical protein